MKHETDFYKGLLEGLKNTREYGGVVKQNYEKNADMWDGVHAEDRKQYNLGAAAGVEKMIKYIDMFIDFLGCYDDNNTGI